MPWTGSAAAQDMPYKAACIIEASTGRVLYAYNADEPLPMASTTKVMTALIALEQCKLDELVTCGPNAYGVPGTSIYLGLGESLKMEDMLQGLMLASGNDAATAIAEHIGGSLAGFADMMNQRALELGATQTHFVTPHGLPNKAHVTSARDLALIAREAMTHDLFRQIVSTQRASIPWEGRDYNRQLRNKNALLESYPGATGIKTGYTKAAGRCLVFGAKRDGLEVIGVVLNCPSWFDQAAALMDQVFANYRQVALFTRGQSVRDIPVEGGVMGAVPAVLAGDLGAPIHISESPGVEIILPDKLEAPLYAGQPVGSLRITAGGQVLGQQTLYLKEGVAKETYWNHLLRLISRWPLLADL